MPDHLNKSQVRKEAREMLKEGKSRQHVYDTLFEKYGWGKEVADVVKFLPSLQASRKYDFWNSILLVIVIVLCALFFLTASSVWILVWFGVIIYGVATKSLQYYVWVSLLAGLGIVGFISIVVYKQLWASHLIEVIFCGALIVPMLVLPIWLERKLCPKPIEKKEIYLNPQGQQRVMIIYEFRDI